MLSRTLIKPDIFKPLLLSLINPSFGLSKPNLSMLLYKKEPLLSYLILNTIGLQHVLHCLLAACNSYTLQKLSIGDLWVQVYDVQYCAFIPGI